MPHARLAVATAAAVVCVALLWITRTYLFFDDEWSLILSAPDWTWVTYMEPHNEHPSMLLWAVYGILLNTVGLRSYVPYMAVLLALHATNVLLVFELVRRRAGQLVAVGASALLIILGAGWEDLLWAFQLAWLASVALGLLMLLALLGPISRPRLAVAAGLLTGSLMFSGVGLTFAAAAIVLIAATPGHRRDVIWFVPTGIALTIWYLTFGHTGQHPNPPPTAANALILPAYELWGLGTSVGGLIGIADAPALVVLLVAVVALAIHWRTKPLDPLALGVVAGLLTFYGVAGAARAQLGYQQSGSGRYAYVGGVLWLILLADVAQGLPWRGTWRPALIACLFLGCFNSGVLFFEVIAGRTLLVQQEVADLKALAAERYDVCLNPNASVDPLVMAQVDTPALYYRAVDRYGDPVVNVPLQNRQAFDHAVKNLRKPGC